MSLIFFIDVKNAKSKGNEREVNLHLNRTLFNQLQLSMKKSDRQKVVQQNRLLQRRATLHTEQLSLSKLEKRKKVLPEGTDPGPLSPRSSRSIPSYARTTKAASLRKNPEKLNLPKIQDSKKKPVGKSAKSSKSTKSSQSTKRKKAKTSR